MKKYNQSDRIILLANNLLGYKEGDDGFMTIEERYSGYNRQYVLTDHQGTNEISGMLAINEIANYVDGVATVAGKLYTEKLNEQAKTAASSTKTSSC
jgi:hypothetical protein